MMDKTMGMRYAEPAALAPLGPRGWYPMVHRLAVVMLMVLLGFAGVELSTARAASAIPIFQGPQDNSQLFAYLNSLVNSINAITLPLLPNVPGGVNQISLTPGVTGGPAVIGLQPGADTNGAIMFNPNGSGNIIMFAQADTGFMQYGNQSSFIPANGLDRCPGSSGIAKTIAAGPSPVVRGYFINGDWLGRQYAALVC